VRRAVHALVEDGWLLAEESDFLVDQAAERYELLHEGLSETLTAAD
jgi:hypothetical protein